MTRTTRSRPHAHTARRLIHDSLDVGHVCSIVGRCTVDYEGRTQSTLDPGERIVVCKPDGTLLVHQPTGHTLVTRQPPSGTHDVTVVDGELHFQSRYDSSDERVNVRFTDLLQVSAYALIDDPDHDAVTVVTDVFAGVDFALLRGPEWGSTGR